MIIIIKNIIINNYFPESNFSTPINNFNKVVLPDPDGPIIENFSPLSNEIDKLDIISLCPYDFDKFFILIKLILFLNKSMSQ